MFAFRDSHLYSGAWILTPPSTWQAVTDTSEHRMSRKVQIKIKVGDIYCWLCFGEKAWTPNHLAFQLQPTSKQDSYWKVILHNLVVTWILHYFQMQGLTFLNMGGTVCVFIKPATLFYKVLHVLQRQCNGKICKVKNWIQHLQTAPLYTVCLLCCA